MARTVENPRKRNYRSVSELILELKKHGTYKPDRVHVLILPIVLKSKASGLVRLNVSFVTIDRTVHEYSVTISKESCEEEITLIRKSMGELEIPEVEGLVFLRGSGEAIYNVFCTSNMQDEKKVQASVEAWLEIVRDNSSIEDFVQIVYYKDERTGITIVDAVCGREQYISLLDGEGKRDMDSIRDLLSGKRCRFADIGDVIAVCKDMTGLFAEPNKKRMSY